MLEDSFDNKMYKILLYLKLRAMSGTPGKAGGLKECEPLKAVEYVSRLKAASLITTSTDLRADLLSLGF